MTNFFVIALVVAVTLFALKSIHFHNFLDTVSLNNKRRLCRVGQRLFSIVFACGVILLLFFLGYHLAYINEVNDENLPVSVYCFVILKMVGAVSVAVGTLGWSFLVWFEFR